MKLTKNPVFLHYFSKSMGILLFILKYMYISLLMKMINGFLWPEKIMASPFKSNSCCAQGQNYSWRSNGCCFLHFVPGVPLIYRCMLSSLTRHFHFFTQNTDMPKDWKVTLTTDLLWKKDTHIHVADHSPGANKDTQITDLKSHNNLFHWW